MISFIGFKKIQYFMILFHMYSTKFPKASNLRHWCMVVYISVPQQQNIFFSWMKRPSDESLRRIIPVQFWEVD